MHRSEPLVHLICGPSGAGKTTYALRLCDEIGGVHFSIDDWMTTLFSADAPQLPDWNWIVDRVGRSEAQILAMTLQLGRLGIPSVHDLGFLGRDQRERVTRAARAAGLATRLHVLDLDREERWQRVSARNAKKGETYRLSVTRAMFDFVDRLWQPPAEDEISPVEGPRTTAA